MTSKQHKNIATLIHLSTFSRFIFPLGNFLGPLLLWATNKEKSNFVDNHGKQALNFQLSILFYTLVIGILSIPFFIFKLFKGFHLDFFHSHNWHFSFHEASPLLVFGGLLGFFAIIAFILELVFIIKASIKAKDGEPYNYPLTINFIK